MQFPAEVFIRPIRKSDNFIIASIIRDSLTEFNANKPGTVFFDQSTDFIFEYFENVPRSRYFVAENENGEVYGGGGIFHSKGLDTHTCELVRMYLTPKARGKKIGMKLLNHCLSEAKTLNFSLMYLETMPELKPALQFYEKNGFTYLDCPLGDTGHTGCGIWMIRSI